MPFDFAKQDLLLYKRLPQAQEQILLTIASITVIFQ
jgi:hypothetical protein